MCHDESKKMQKKEETVTVYFENRAFQVPAGITVAAAALGYFNAGHTCVNAGTGEKRGPHCLMGVCFDCMVEINGVPNRQGCMVRVADGMEIQRQDAPGGGE